MLWTWFCAFLFYSEELKWLTHEWLKWSFIFRGVYVHNKRRTIFYWYKCVQLSHERKKENRSFETKLGRERIMKTNYQIRYFYRIFRILYYKTIIFYNIQWILFTTYMVYCNLPIFMYIYIIRELQNNLIYNQQMWSSLKDNIIRHFFGQLLNTIIITSPVFISQFLWTG